MTACLIKRSIVALFIVCGIWFVASQSKATNAATFENNGAAPQQNPAGGQLAEQKFKNIQIFKGQPAKNVMENMRFFTQALGVECSFCHVEHAFDKDDKNTKKFARTMYQIAQFANKSIGEERVTCYTCHRGHQEPEEPADVKAKAEEILKKGEDDKRPAETAFKNIQLLKGETAGRVIAYMRLFTIDLGVKCDFCHVEHAFDKDDKPTKLMARKMITMMGGIAKDYTQGKLIITCYTCHKGQTEPVSMPSATAKPEDKKTD